MKRRRSLGSDSWPCISTCQEKLVGCPALIFSNVSAESVSGQVMSSSLRRPPWTPNNESCSARTTPRRLGSPASTCIRRWASASRFICGPSCSGVSNNSPLRAKNSPPPGWVTERNSSGCCVRRCTSALVAALTSSGRRRLDDGDDQFELRKRRFECGLALAPRNIVRNQLVDIGRDREMRRRIDAGRDRQQDSRGDHFPRVPRAKFDCPNDKGGERVHVGEAGISGDFKR